MKHKKRTRMRRRTFLQALGGAAIALPFYQFLANPNAHAFNGMARRIIFFYFPDGVPGSSEGGSPSMWHASGSETSYNWPQILEPIQSFKDRTILFNGLDMGRTDEGSHPGGAKKLLTAADGGQNESIDQHIARTLGANSPHRHVYLGVQANHNGASGDKHISYVSSGVSTPPEDNPTRAFDRLFQGKGMLGGPSNPGPMEPVQDFSEKSVIDGVLQDMNELKTKLGSTEKTKLDLHLEALREVEKRVAMMEIPKEEMPMQPQNACGDPTLNAMGYEESRLYDPEMFPAVMRMQIDVMVQAMACNLTRVGVVQGSFHTSELIMSRFMGTDLHDPNFDMRSHQASHYGPSHDLNKREFRDFVAQRRWFLQQYAYLLSELDKRPEGDGTMLDYSLVLLCTEVCDGNTHAHSNMPFLLSGGGAGSVRTGRLIQHDNTPHSNLFVALARAMGSSTNNFGWHSSGPLYGVLPG